ncbi:MAG: type II toxin-antitoxin system HicB family antitoxin [Desulfomonilaceae bacterium]
MKLKVIIHEAEEGGYWAEVPALPGCFTQAETLDELMHNVREAAEGWLLASEDLKATGNDHVAEVVI